MLGRPLGICRQALSGPSALASKSFSARRLGPTTTTTRIEYGGPNLRSLGNEQLVLVTTTPPNSGLFGITRHKIAVLPVHHAQETTRLLPIKVQIGELGGGG